MADNVEITAGTGTDIATDDVAGVHYQKVKIALGADGAIDGLLDPGQAAMAASLPVVIASDQTAIPVSDAGPSWTSAYLHTASADATGGADVTAAPASGQKIVVDDVIVSVDTEMKVIFEEETSGTDVLVLYMPAYATAQVTPRGKIKLATADKKLRVDTSVAGNIAITVVYHSEA